MTGKLITLPLRVSLESARLITRAAGAAAGRAASLAGQTIKAVTPDLRRAEPIAAAPRERRDAPEPAPPEQHAPEPPPPEPRAPDPVAPAPPTPIVDEDVHVSEEPELVREVAEPGAEDGAGADVTVMEPWSGYRHMTAHEVITRAQQSSPAELAAVRLYESRHRGRETVLAAVDRQLKLGTGADPA
ncbi:MAG: hypothetical protein JO304_02915 [Solirubrobacterales bacterium]|nr:hypothetical protein [Solirubrobacterales bacterium]